MQRTAAAMAVDVVWLKRDLRLRDHAALRSAVDAAGGAPAGRVVVLWVDEPSIWSQPEHDLSHRVFCGEALAELDDELRARGACITWRIGEMPDVLAELARELEPFGGLVRLHSHEETGLAVTFERDRRVRRWCEAHGVEWSETPQNGVVRRLRDRDGWSSRWLARMKPAPLDAPPAIPGLLAEVRSVGGGAAFDHGRPPSPAVLAERLGLRDSGKRDVQVGGERHAAREIGSFLDERGVGYRKDMSSPVAGATGCSRISSYLAWGCISVRSVYHATRARVAELRDLPATERDPRWLPSLKSFEGRLRWHCHFMQKLESEPEIEFSNFNRAFDGLREDEFDEAKFAAWCEGRTGYPMVDACMRSLHATGWVNFRMRAMLVSFAAYHLWLHWREPARFLARHFLDFEPGIHFSQFQMQSGTTGINTVRIYSPAKQVVDQDPRGEFVRRWLPELEGVPDEHLAEPHRMPGLTQRMAGCVIGRDYPEPIVDHRTAYAEAKDRIFRARGTREARAAADGVQRRHGSRRSAPARRRR
jgi:deoxyribodipyrimidine photo-lyase